MKTTVIDEGDPKAYWTQIPNIVCCLGLKPQELALYIHLKRTAGENGKCTKSTATLARESEMGAASVSRAKTVLEAVHPLLGKPLIRTRDVPNPRGGKPFQEITLTDIWAENIAEFTSSIREVATPNQVPNQLPNSCLTSSLMEIKKNIRKEEHKEEPPLTPPFVGQAFLEALSAYDETAKDRKVKESLRQRKMLFNKLRRWGEEKATQALEDCVIGSWRGVFEPHQNSNGHKPNGNGLCDPDRPRWMAGQPR